MLERIEKSQTHSTTFAAAARERTILQKVNKFKTILDKQASALPYEVKEDLDTHFAGILAKQFLRLAINTQIQPPCADEGKKAVAEFEYRFPMPTQMTLAQEKQGIDEFYRNWRNQSISLISVQNIVRMQILGRPQAEIDTYISAVRAGQS